MLGVEMGGSISNSVHQYVGVKGYHCKASMYVSSSYDKQHSCYTLFKDTDLESLNVTE